MFVDIWGLAATKYVDEEGNEIENVDDGKDQTVQVNREQYEKRKKRFENGVNGHGGGDLSNEKDAERFTEMYKNASEVSDDIVFERVEKDDMNFVVSGGFQGTASVGLVGASFELGVAYDGSNYSLYGNLSHAVGADLSAGPIFSVYVPKDNKDDFTVDKVQGWNENYNYGLLSESISVGGDSQYKGLLFDDYSDFHPKYKILGYGRQTVRQPIPAGFTRDKGYTWNILKW